MLPIRQRPVQDSPDLRRTSAAALIGSLPKYR
jgi:hypothetical protein